MSLNLSSTRYGRRAWRSVASRIVGALGLVAALAAPALAKLPPVSEEAKAKAAEAAAKTAWSDKVAAYKLCLAMDKVAASYQETQKAAGNQPPAPIATPACTDPGAYAPPAQPPAPPPLESSGAHSPAGTALGPPSSKATEAEQKGGIKK